MSYLAVRKKNKNQLYLVKVVNGKRVVETVKYRQHIYDYLGVMDDRAKTHHIAHDIYGKPCVKRFIDNGRLIAEQERLYNMYKLKNKNEIYCGDVDLKYQFITERYPEEIVYKPDDFIRAFIDIETSMTDYTSNHKVRVKRKDGSSEVPAMVSELWSIRDTHDVLDETTQTWGSITKSCYFATSGFPDPWQAPKEVLSISVVLSGSGDKYVFGLKDYPGEPEGFNYIKFDDEASMLKHFWILLDKRNVSILCHWNGDSFDMPYLVNRSVALLGRDDSGRPNVVDLFPVKNFYQRPHKLCPTPGTVYIPGWVSYDLMNLYKKFEKDTEESYSLDAIGKKLLGDGKVDYHSEYRNLTELYHDNFKKFIDYNLRDVTLMVEIDEKKKHVDLAMKIAYMMKVMPDDVYSNTKAWDVKLYDIMRRQGIVVPKSVDHVEKKLPEDMTEEENEQAKIDKANKYAGGYVAKVNPGKHADVVVYDVNSLYPNIMIAFNMTPWTYIGNSLGAIADSEKDKKEARIAGFVKDSGELAKMTDDLKIRGQSVCPSGALFQTNEQDFVLAVVEQMFKRRIALKKQSEAIKQQRGETEETDILDLEVQAIKITLNSLYGAFGAKHFRYYRREVAEAITLTGQYLIQRVANAIEAKIDQAYKVREKDRVIYMDTDSIFLSLKDITDIAYQNSGMVRDRRRTVEWIQQICERNVDVAIAESIASDMKILNALKNPFKMAREKICEGALFMTKKRYGLLISYKDGRFLETTKTEYKGLEIVRSDSPMVVRKTLRDLIDYLMTPECTAVTMASRIKEFRDRYESLDAQLIARPMLVKDIEKYNPYKNSKKNSVLLENTKRIRIHKGTPVHVKASWLYNDFIKRKGFDSDYPVIRSFDRIRWVYLKTPNPVTIGYEVIAFFDRYGFPGRGRDDISGWIDREKQFEKTFYNKIVKVCKVIGWDIDREIRKQGRIQL